MFNFLFGGRKAKLDEPVVETQRETFTRLVTDLNAAIDQLAEKPKVTLDPGTGHIMPEMPEQFPDEALALPGPTEAAKDAASAKVTEGDAVAKTADTTTAESKPATASAPDARPN